MLADYADTKNQMRENDRITKNNEERFYDSLDKAEQVKLTPPSRESITTFWKYIWSNPVTHNNTATWIYNETKQYAHIDATTQTAITHEEITQTKIHITGKHPE